MTQDTRKDRRVKIVSLNVRYKSATVDEFIENHAHDVSRGGIYIKTGSPFPPGTLLKFEIRLVSDQALIMGVGRVVWKRDTSQGTGDRPAGMGVKFIKIDEPSKSVIDKLMNTRADAGRAYESEADATVSASEAAPAPVRAPAGRVGKSTVLGVGSLPQPGASSAPSTRPPGAPSSPPRPTATIAMFPKATPEAADNEPKQEQTVMKQAAELLEEALREAGGSMEDVGTNPLFAGATPAGKASAGDRTSETSKAPPSDGSGVSPSSAPEAAKARAMVAGMSPAPTISKVTSDPPRTVRESPVARGVASEGARPSSVRPSVRPSPSSITSRPPPKKKGSAGTLMLLGVVTAAAVAGVTFRDKLLGGGAPAEPVGTASAAQAALPSATASATTSAEPGAASTAPAASDAPAASASAASAMSAGAAAQSSMDAAAASPKTAPVIPPPAFTARPAIGRSIPVPPPTAPTMGSKPLAPPSVSAGPGEPTSPGISATPTAPTTAPTAPAPVAKPKPAAKPADDNPY
jgi:uncharacterized protein (TIGR02266 family)